MYIYLNRPAWEDIEIDIYPMSRLQVNLTHHNSDTQSSNACAGTADLQIQMHVLILNSYASANLHELHTLHNGRVNKLYE